MVGFTPYCPQFLLVLGAFFLSVLSSASETGFRPGDRLGHCITFYCFALEYSSLAFTVCFRSLSICTVKQRLKNYE